MGCIFASVFHRFWLISGAMMGGKIKEKSIKNSIGKTIEKRRAARWPTRRSKSLRGCAAPGARTQGEGGGGEVKTLPKGEVGVVGSTGLLNHLSPEGWDFFGLSDFFDKIVLDFSLFGSIFDIETLVVGKSTISPK